MLTMKITPYQSGTSAGSRPGSRTGNSNCGDLRIGRKMWYRQQQDADPIEEHAEPKRMILISSSTP
jgi:hypothetical protein